MKNSEKILKRMKSLLRTFLRYPATLLFLSGLVLLNAIEINGSHDRFLKVVLTFAIGALFTTVAQVLYERFYQKGFIRFVLIVGAFLLTALFYVGIKDIPNYDSQLYVRLIVTAFTLFIAFIWIPTIKNKINFNQSFMSAFKGFFITLLFSTTIYIGISLILMAIDQLLMPINEKLFLHMANLVYLLFAPLYFLSLIPAFGMEKESLAEKGTIEERNIILATSCPKYLEIFISYIIVPIAGIFTLILLLYIVANIRGEFWTDNLLEPMLVSYSISVIVIYILTSELKNKSASIFKKVFPKVLAPIVLFQTIASIIKIGEVGITHGRYYVILYGIFAFLSAIVFIVLPTKRNGFIAWMLILFSVISMVPPIDAFTVSKTSQVSQLKLVLEENKMLEKNHIISNNKLSDRDQEKILRSITYLKEMGYIDEIYWLDDYTKDYDFINTFGFDENITSDYQVTYFYGELDRSAIVNISNYDYFSSFNLWMGTENKDFWKKGSFSVDGQDYLLASNIDGKEGHVSIEKENGEKIIDFEIKEISERFEGSFPRNEILSLEESTFTVKNSMAELTLVVENMNLNESARGKTLDARVFVFVKIN